ncbi:MAG: tRNA (5-methylaminomethyl-2-thiouridine)(34)-methyltransferase MnmD [Paracoccaceae bacterium]
MSDHPPLQWAGDLPVDPVSGDGYWSPQGGLAEARHVYLGGNDLPARLRPNFAVAEVGFGTGLNFLALWAAWDGSSVTYTGFEARPLAPEDRTRALGAFPEVATQAQALTDLLAAAPEGGEVAPGLVLRLIHGDARETLPAWQGRADAWFLDGFAPALAPDLWTPGMLRAVVARTAPGGTCASFTAAGHVRRGLAEAGFAVTRAPGFGRKRHMTRGVLT